MQILTTEYLLEGQMEPDDDFFSNAQVEDPADYLDKLTRVQIRPAGQLMPPATTLPNWYITFGKTIVALIPCDEDSLTLAQEAYEEYTHSRRVQVYVGPYVIEGQLLNEDEDFIDFEDTSGYIPLTNAEITHLHPNAQLRSHRAAWMLVNGDLAHGFCLL
ncbi:MAG TPA: hypothetical protein PK530_04430 [Anaerolineales bacterium]|nr:hypothetical protein [Anaerolineales bacterium]